MLLHQPHVDFAGISQTPRELSSPPSAVCAAAEREGDTRRHDSDDLLLWTVSLFLLQNTGHQHILDHTERVFSNFGQDGNTARQSSCRHSDGGSI